MRFSGKLIMLEEDQQILSTAKPTPFHSHFFHPEPNLLATPSLFPKHYPPLEERFNNEPEEVIFGTAVSPKETMTEIRRFFLQFEVTMERQQEIMTEKVYLVKLRDLEVNQFSTGISSFSIDAFHIQKYSAKLYVSLIYFPIEIIHFFDLILQELYEQQFIEPDTNQHTRTMKIIRKRDLRVGIFNLRNEDRVFIRNLSPKHLGQLVGIRGIAIRTSEVYPQMKCAVFQCSVCSAQERRYLVNARVEQPKRCPNCKLDSSMQLIHNRCQFANKQYIKFQEILENVTRGSAPSSIQLIAYEEIVDQIRPGDCVQITGIYRCNKVSVSKNINLFRSIFNTYVEVISFERMEEKSNKIKVDKKNYNEEERKEFFKLANQPDAINKLAHKFAPSIFGHIEIKKGLLAQLFGGVRKAKYNGGHIRGEINVCLVGDPSTAKSQFLHQVHRISHRSIYTCGRGSSAVGLTANVRKDPQTRQFILESGALVLSDEGICCIDEFDKMGADIHTVLLQAMEQQTISIAKAGIVCQLNSRTSILAAANPISSKYDCKKSVVKNISMPPALLSRFDLIYIMLDVANEVQDRMIAAHILDLYTLKLQDFSQNDKKAQFLANYISFGRTLQPKISDQAADKIKEEYLHLRRSGQSNNTIQATPRLLESMIRLSEAFAKMRLSNEVTGEDAEEAIELIRFATLRSATDPESGLIDMDMLATGRSAVSRRRIEDISYKVKVLLLTNESKYCRSTDIENLEKDYRKLYGNSGSGSFDSKEPVSRSDLAEALKFLDASEDIVLYSNHREQMVFRLKRFNEPQPR